MKTKDVYQLKVGDRFRYRGRDYIFDRIMGSSNAKGVQVKAWPEGNKTKEEVTINVKEKSNDDAPVEVADNA